MSHRHRPALDAHAIHAPIVCGVHLWPDFAATAEFSLFVGFVTAMVVGVVHAVATPSTWWVPVLVILVTSAPSVWDRVCERLDRPERRKHAEKEAELRHHIGKQDARIARAHATIDNLNAMLVDQRKALDEQKATIEELNRVLIDQRQTLTLQNDMLAALQAQQTVTQGHLNEALKELAAMKAPNTTIIVEGDVNA